MLSAGINPSRSIYRNAIYRLTSWRHSRIVEIVLWSIFAAIAGLLTSDMLSYSVAMPWIVKPCYWILVAGTPFVVFWAVSRIQMTTTDEVLKTIPLKPHQIVLPRISALLAVYLRYMLPVVLTLALTYEVIYAHNYPGFFERLLRTDAGSLTRFPLYSPLRLEGETMWELDKAGNYIHGMLFTLSAWWRGIVIGLGFLQWIGWLLLPITWGLYWRTRMTHSGFALAYFAYIIPVAAMVYANRFRFLRFTPRGGRPFVESTFNLAGLEIHTGWTFDWVWMYVYGLSGILLALLMYFLTLRIWARARQ